ncbi:hypothetical protein ABK040_009605 [Willaertia magna]
MSITTTFEQQEGGIMNNFSNNNNNMIPSDEKPFLLNFLFETLEDEVHVIFAFILFILTNFLIYYFIMKKKRKQSSPIRKSTIDNNYILPPMEGREEQSFLISNSTELTEDEIEENDVNEFIPQQLGLDNESDSNINDINNEEEEENEINPYLTTSFAIPSSPSSQNQNEQEEKQQPYQQPLLLTSHHDNIVNMFSPIKSQTVGQQQQPIYLTTIQRTTIESFSDKPNAPSSPTIGDFSPFQPTPKSTLVVSNLMNNSSLSVGTPSSYLSVQ